MARLQHPENGTVVSVGDHSAEEMLAMGWVDLDGSAGDIPGGNASRDEWAAYAVENGYTEEDVADLKRGEIRDLFA